MIAGLSLLITMMVSIAIVRTAAVALRLTGLAPTVARFQARSAFTGTGFTTAETEAIVNNPIRRRIIAALMLLGNVGFVTVLATFVATFVATEASMHAISVQLVWVLGALAVLWLVALNPLSDRLMCASLSWVLRHFTSLGERSSTELLHIAVGFRIVEHIVADIGVGDTLELARVVGPGRGVVLGVEHENGVYVSTPPPHTVLQRGDRVFLYQGASDGEAASAS